jgi:hypothetical protein
VAGRLMPGGETIVGHRAGGGRRIGWWRSVRAQLIAPILVASLGLAILGTVQTTTAAAAARDAGRARVLASTVTTTTRLAHEVEREKAETIGQRLRGPKAGLQLLTAQRQRTDAAAGQYRGDARAGLAAAPALAPVLDAAEAALNRLPAARDVALTGDPSGGEADLRYRALSDALLAVADALPAQLDNVELANAARSIAAVAAIEHFAALERDQLRTVFASGALAPSDLAAVAVVAGARQQRESELQRAADAGQLVVYSTEVVGPDVDNAERIRSAILAGGQAPDALKVDPDVWYIAQSGFIRRVDLAGLRLSNGLDSKAAQIANAGLTRAWLSAISAGGAGLGALVAAIVLAVRTSRRLRQLRGAALTTARRDLPDAIYAIGERGSHQQLIERGRPAAATTWAIASTNDEIGEVAAAFGIVYSTALRLAGEQAELRLDVVRTAEALARRIRTLITRQLRLLDDFERNETDPEMLSRLFALDHIATRLRRAGENLLVLAGGEPGRPVTDAYGFAEIVAAAASEIEQYQRVETTPSEVAIAGPAVGDVVHLLAELLENAANFSAPSMPVRVAARRDGDGAVIRVCDAGIGIVPQRLAEINSRLARPATLTSAAVGTMGLYVVAHLAARRGIRVQLYGTGSSDGTIAEVSLPSSAVAPQTTVPGVVQYRHRSELVDSGRGMAADAIGAATDRPDRAAVVVAGEVTPTRVSWFRRHRADAHDLGSAEHRWSPPSTFEGSTTMGSLPRRDPGALSGPPAPPSRPAGSLVDPAVLRTRLTAYAEGVSAILRHNSAQSPTSDAPAFAVTPTSSTTTDPKDRDEQR